MSIRTVRTTCPLDCPGACALVAEFEDQRLLRIKGDRDHPFTQGVICGKVTRYHALQHGPRIEQPLVREGAKGEGRFRTVSWPAALEQVANRLAAISRQYGSEAILPYYYGGTLGMVQRPAIERLANRAGFSRQDRNICYSIGFAGWQAGVGLAVGPSPLEIAASDLIILWGINAAATHITLMEHVKRARRRGALLVVVDPCRNQTARLADIHIQLRPGTDGALATAMLHMLFAEDMVDAEFLKKFTDFEPGLREHLVSRTPAWAAAITGLEEESIRALARMYGQSRSSFIRIGLGMSRQRNGAVNIHAISCLPSATGAWRRGGALFATGDAFGLNDSPVKQPDWLAKPTRILDMSRLGALLHEAEPRIHGLLVFNANPAVSCPNAGLVMAGLQREDLFTVVHEQVMSDTARLADVILPATTFLEHTDLYKSYGQYSLQYAPAVTAPRGEARCNNDTVNALAQAMGYTDPPFFWDSERMVREVLQASGRPAPETWPARWLDCTPDEDTCHFRHGFPQPDGRFHFQPHWPDATMPVYPDHWPVNSRDTEAQPGSLTFMTPPALEVLNSTFTGVESIRQKRGVPRLWLHPKDARQRGIGDGNLVRVWNHQASLTFVCQVTEDTQPGVCLCESNHPAMDFPEGLPLNALTSDHRVAPAGGPGLHDHQVFVALSGKG